MDKRDLIERCREHNVRFVRLQFTELYGQLKNVSIPVEELERALDNELMFDGSSIRGYKRIEQSDMYFQPDPSTFTVLPWRERESGAVARLICDVADPDGTPFAGDPRVALKRVMAEAKELGYTMQVGPEAEFFLFKRAPDGTPLVDPHDRAGYFDVAPIGPGREHAPRHRGHAGQDGLPSRGVAPRGGDRPARDRLPARRGAAVRRQPDHVPLGGAGRRRAARHARDVHAEADLRRERLGHAHEQSLSTASGENAFYDAKDELQLSDVAYGYIAGVLEHLPAHHGGRQPDGELVQAARARLRGAGLHRVVARQPLGRHPRAHQARPLDARRAAHARPDGQPVPGLAVHAGGRARRHQARPQAAGAGQQEHLPPDEEESEALGIGSLPHNLSYALDALEADGVLRKALGDHIFEAYLAEKRAEWASTTRRCTSGRSTSTWRLLLRSSAASAAPGARRGPAALPPERPGPSSY